MTDEPPTSNTPASEPRPPGGLSSRDALLAAVGVASAAGSLLTLPLWIALLTLGAFAGVAALLLHNRRLAFVVVAVVFVVGGTVALVLGGSSDHVDPRQAQVARDSDPPDNNQRLRRLERRIDALILQLAAAEVDTSVPLPDLQPLRAAILEYINRLRDRKGVAPLRRSVVLERAAQRHVADMLKSNTFDHAGSKGESVEDRIGGGWRSFGELIAYGFKPFGWVDLLKDLQASASHRQALETPVHRYAGIGVDLGPFQGSDATVLTIVVGSHVETSPRPDR